MRARTSSWRRISPDSLIPHSKASGQYLNSVLAKIEAEKSGYEEAILLDDHGRVCEGTGENVFVVKDGVIVTPPQTASILDGINRKSVIEIATDLGYKVLERDVARAELVLADEVFLTGTAAELTPMRVDRRHRHRSRHARARSRARSRRRSRTPSTAATRATASGSTSCRCPRAPERALGGFGPDTANTVEDMQVQIYDTTLRDGMQGEGMSLSAEEKLRVAHALDEPRRPPDRGRLPELEPEGGGRVRSARAGVVRARPGRRLRDDPPPRRGGGRGSRPAPARRQLRAGLHARRQDVAAAPREGHPRRPRGEPAR